MENDDFCDDLVTGEDERSTAACSLLVPDLKLKFRCGPNNSTQIPLSRVGDGVCDCCDGSDEIKSGESACPDVCAKQQMDAKMEALSWHRYVQTGARKRQEMVNSMRRKKTREVKNLETLRQDFTNVRKLSLDIRYWLRHEESRESSRHFELLRERELRCITGMDLYCDYWQHVFLSDDEMWVENAPEGYMASTRGRVSKTKSQRETDYRASLSALERVRGTTCDAPDIIPDESLKIHTTVGEYLAFQTTPGGVAMRKRGPKQHRKDTLFVKFLEGGPNGPIHGLLAIGEVASLLLLPVSLPLYGLYYGLEMAWDKTWQAIEACAEASSDIGATEEHNGDGNINATSRSHVPAALSRLCVYAKQTGEPGTVPFEVVQFFDYTTYSYPMYLMDNYISPALKWPYMISRLLWRAPIMYFDYHIKSRYLDLPPTRHTCLLRTSLRAAEQEMDSLLARIQEERDLLLSLAEAEAELGGVAQLGSEADIDGSRTATEDFLDTGKRMSIVEFFSRRGAEQSKRAAATKEARASRDRRASLVDYGESGEWEALKNLCVSRDVHGLLWELCFYKRVTAGSALLGTWVSWGPLVPLSADYDEQGLVDGDDGDASAGSGSGGSGGGGSGSGIAGALSWLGGLAGAMRGIRVDRVQQAFEAKRKATSGYWQHQSYSLGATCNGSDVAALAAERYEKEQVRLQLLGGKAGFSDGVKEGGGEEEEEEEEELAMTANGAVRKSLLQTGADSAGTVSAGSGTARRQAEVRLRCGHETAIASVSSSESDPCLAVLVVECPMACDGRAERLSLNRLDELGVYGFTKRSSAAQTVERHLEAGEEKRREATKRLAEQQQKTGDIQKQKEEEALKAASLNRRKKALDKMARDGLKQLEQEEEQATRAGDKAKASSQAERKRKRDKEGKKKKKREKKGKGKGKKKKKTKTKTKEEGLGEDASGIERLKMDVVEGVPEGQGQEQSGATANRLDDDSSEEDLFESLPDDEEEVDEPEQEQEQEQEVEEEEVIELSVDPDGEARAQAPTQKQAGDDPSLKLVGGIPRPVDLPLNN